MEGQHSWTHTLYKIVYYVRYYHNNTVIFARILYYTLAKEGPIQKFNIGTPNFDSDLNFLLNSIRSTHNYFIGAKWERNTMH